MPVRDLTGREQAYTVQVEAGLAYEFLISLTAFGLPSGTSCTLTAFGEDAVSLAGGNGSFTGAFAVVVNLDNPVDAPEFVVMTGTFGAHMQILVDANGQRLPLIQITNGTLSTTDVFGVPVAYVGLFFRDLTPEMFAPASFGGTFRLPFVVHNDKKVKPQKGVQAFYLGDNGDFIPIQQNETSLGYATVRVEVGF